MERTAYSLHSLSSPLAVPEDILARAVKQGDCRVLEYVLDVILSTLQAEYLVLVRVEDSGRILLGRRQGRAELPRPADHLREETVRAVFGRSEGIYCPPEETTAGRWCLGIPVFPGLRSTAALFTEGTGRLEKSYREVSPDALHPISNLVALALLVDELDGRIRHLERQVSRGTPETMIQDEKPRMIIEWPAVGSERQLEKPLKTLFPDMVAESGAMRGVLSAVADLAKADIPILIEGQSGTGKELIAASIHRLSPWREGPFITENCGAIPDSLFEAEFFGYEKGAFTGASQAKIGLLERAHGGSLFLDEIGEMDIHQQKKLLRVIQERKVRRLGARRDRPLEFRLISATNKVLEDLVAQGRFREDLYYRLNAASITLPSLHERVEDIPLLVDHFNLLFSTAVRRKPLSFHGRAIQTLTAYKWPGNVRELRHEIWRLVTSLRDEVLTEHLSRRILRSLERKTRLRLETRHRTLDELEREFLGEVICESLKLNHGNVTLAAQYLGVARATLYRKMERYGIPHKKKR